MLKTKLRGDDRLLSPRSLYNIKVKTAPRMPCAECINLFLHIPENLRFDLMAGADSSFL